MTDPAAGSTAARLETLRRESNLVLAEASQAQQMAAENLLEKAAVALHQGDGDTARAMVRRTQALGHDDHEGVDVCSWSVHMTLFTLVTDVLDDSDVEWAWVDAATTVLPTLSETGREELIDVLGTIRQDYELDHAAWTRLGPLVRGAVRRPAITEGRVLDVEEVLDVLAAIAAFEDAVDALEGEPS